MNSFSLVTALSGLIFLIAGLIMKRIPPGKINSFYGYRTLRSMKNLENWVEGNRYSIRLLIRSGVLLLIIDLIGHFFIENGTSGWLVAVILFLMLSSCPIFFIENQLKRMFGKSRSWGLFLRMS